MNQRNKKQNYFFQNALSWSRIKSGNKQKSSGSLSHLPAIQIGSCFDALATNPSFIYKGMLFNESENVWEALDTEIYDLCKNMYESLCNYPLWIALLKQKHSFQEEGFGSYEVNGKTIKTKCKLDVYVEGVAIIDLKTTKEVTEEKFLESMIKSEYDKQGVWYLEHYPNVNTFVCIGVSKTYPHNVFTYKFHRNSEVYLSVKAKIDKKVAKLQNLEMYEI